ncbi:MAG: hypothetical protein ACLFTI_09215 [Anaerolineales bacterium]
MRRGQWLARRGIWLAILLLLLSAGVGSHTGEASPAAPYLPPAAIQGNGPRSPYVDEEVQTSGALTGFFEGHAPIDCDGFFLQDPVGDGDPAASDAIFVAYTSTLLPTFQLGDWITVTGVVEEFSEAEGANCAGDACLTRVRVDPAAEDALQIGAAISLPAALPLAPPGDPDAATLYWESLEGMRVTYPATATVVGPTRSNTLWVIAGATGLERVMHDGPHTGRPVAARHYERYGLIDGRRPPGLLTGSTVRNVAGPLGFTAGAYTILTQAGAPWEVVESAAAPPAPPTWPAPAPGEFSAATFHLQSLHDPQSARLTKVVTTVLGLGCPSLIALQEIRADAVITPLQTALADAGCSYDAAHAPPDANGEATALLWRPDQVTDVTWSAEYQECSTHGDPDAAAYDDDCAGAGADLHPLFARRPIVLTGTLTYERAQTRFAALAAHLPAGDDPAVDQRRQAQAAFLADLGRQMAISRTRHVMLLGDLGVSDLQALPALSTGHAITQMLNAWEIVPAAERYTEIERGIARARAHILLAPPLFYQLQAAAPLHANADFPNGYDAGEPTMWGASDHDPLAATFDITELLPHLQVTKAVTPTENVAPRTLVTYTLALSNTGVVTAYDVHLRDALPANVNFGAWVRRSADVSATTATRVLTWTGDLPPMRDHRWVFTARLRDEADLTLQMPIPNTATFDSANGGAGEATATFHVGERLHWAYLPVLLRRDGANFSP